LEEDLIELIIFSMTIFGALWKRN